MSPQKIERFSDVLTTIANRSATSWIYLPMDKNWSLDSDAAVLESKEVPPELEDDREAGMPQFATENGLIQVLPVTMLQDIVANVQMQKHDATAEDKFKAFIFYYKHDAFMDLTCN